MNEINRVIMKIASLEGFVKGSMEGVAMRLSIIDDTIRRMEDNMATKKKTAKKKGKKK